MLKTVNITHLHGIPVAGIHDSQHSEVKWKQQNLRMAILHGAGMERIITCAKELVTITLEHFKTEESAMDTCTLQSFATHRRFHIEMIESLEEISGALEHRRIRGAIELIKLFDVRLTYHLDVEDAALERELRNMK